MPSLSPGSSHLPDYSVTVDTVTDRVTGLIWQREPPERYEGCAGTGCTWDEAKTYCATRNGPSSVTNSGWRLPTKIELESLLRVDGPGDDTFLLDREVFPRGPDRAWTSTPHVGRNGEAWYVAFTNMGSSYMETANSLAVICVR